MARRLLAIALAIVLLGIGTVVGSLLSSTPRAQAKATHIRAYNPDNRTTEKNVDADDNGRRDEFGDFFVGAGPLLNHPNGKKIGNERHQCWNEGGTQNSFTALCNGSFWLEGRGKIMGYGSFTATFTRDGANAPKLAITGGTGEFRSATGTITLHFKDNGTVFEFNLTG